MQVILYTDPAFSGTFPQGQSVCPGILSEGCGIIDLPQ